MASDAEAAQSAVPARPHKELAQVNVILAMSVVSWLKKRGKAIRPKLTDEQKKQLHECFELMDADGSGAIDAEELGAAFKLLGLQVSQNEIKEMLDEVDRDGSGEVEYPEFLEIMTSTLAKLAERKETENKASAQVPFALMATAYRRKRLMEGLISGDKDITAQIAQMSDEQSREQLQQQKAQDARAQKQETLGSSFNRRNSTDYCVTKWQRKNPDFRRHIQELVESMTPDERRIIGSLFNIEPSKQERKLSAKTMRKGTQDLAKARTSGGQWWKSPKHNALLEMPEVGVNIKFRKPTLQMFKGTPKKSGRGGGALQPEHSSHSESSLYSYYYQQHYPANLHARSSAAASPSGSTRASPTMPYSHFLPDVRGSRSSHSPSTELHSPVEPLSPSGFNEPSSPTVDHFRLPPIGAPTNPPSDFISPLPPPYPPPSSQPRTSSFTTTPSTHEDSRPTSALATEPFNDTEPSSSPYSRSSSKSESRRSGNGLVTRSGIHAGSRGSSQNGAYMRTTSGNGAAMEPLQQRQASTNGAYMRSVTGNDAGMDPLQQRQLSTNGSVTGFADSALTSTSYTRRSSSSSAGGSTRGSAGAAGDGHSAVNGVRADSPPGMSALPTYTEAGAEGVAGDEDGGDNGTVSNSEVEAAAADVQVGGGDMAEARADDDGSGCGAGVDTDGGAVEVEDEPAEQ